MLLLYLLIGYLIGSIPWALIVGKLFFDKDIRLFGSGNLGGTNAGRVLGKFYGIMVAALDVSKALLAVWIVSLFDKEAAVFAGLMSAVGHCYPVFAQFRGGKAVACSLGFLLGSALFVTQDFTIFFSAFATFFLMIAFFKMVSLASMTAMVVASGTALMFADPAILWCTIALTVLVFIRHHENIRRIIEKKESKISLFRRK